MKLGPFRKKEYAEGREGWRKRTSAGFFPKNTEFTLVKWEASTIWVFISSAERSRTVSQNGTRSWLECLTQVSMIDQISLHRTSVATWGYLSVIR